MTGWVAYVDAGHGLAFTFSTDGCRRLERTAPPLGTSCDRTGIFPVDDWDTQTVVLAPGETLLVISNGFLDFPHTSTFPTLEETLARAGRVGLLRLPVPVSSSAPSCSPSRRDTRRTSPCRSCGPQHRRSTSTEHGFEWPTEGAERHHRGAHAPAESEERPTRWASGALLGSRGQEMTLRALF